MNQWVGVKNGYLLTLFFSVLLNRIRKKKQNADTSSV
jgi:hypothetical protein